MSDLKRNVLVAAIFCGLSFSPAYPEAGQALVSFAGDANIKQKDDDEAWLYAQPHEAQWLKDARFGLFVHWNPIAQLGHDLSWSRKGGRRWGKIKVPDHGFIPMEKYDNLYKTFNPVDFNPTEWVNMMKAVGQKYIVFTAKHHDGFCMYDSAYTEYDIMSSYYGKDILKELTDACHAAGIKVGIYYSPTDWYHPDFRTENHDRYVEYYFNQMRELVTKYAPVDVIWWDAFGFHGEAELIKTKEMTKMLRELQPGILLNNRAGLRGDFDTPEQLVGRFQKDRPWETCMTINDQWGYRPNNLPKSKKVLVETLVRCAGGNGNFLLNLGPMANGKFDPLHENRLRELGDWNQQYGQSVFNTKGGPYMPGVYGATTYRKNTIYLHILDWQDKNEVVFPALPFNVISHHVITGGHAQIKSGPDGLKVTMENGKHELDTIIELRVDGDVSTMEPIKVPYRSGSLALNKPAQASSVIFNDRDHHGPKFALDDDVDTLWRTDTMAVDNVSFEVDLERTTLVNRIRIRDAHKRTRHFSLQYQNDGNWVDLYESFETIGHHFDECFEPFEARKIRLLIHKAIAGPQLAEFHVLYSPEMKKDYLTYRLSGSDGLIDEFGGAKVAVSKNSLYNEAPRFSKVTPAPNRSTAKEKTFVLGMSYGKKRSGFYLDAKNGGLSSQNGAISFWMKPESNQNGHYVLFAPKPQMVLFFKYKSSLVYGVGAGTEKKSCSANIQDKQWQHVVLTWSGLKNTAHVYINGTLAGSCEQLPDSIQFGGQVRVGNYDDVRGNRPANIKNQYRGSIFDFQIYSKALQQNEVSALYANPGLTLGEL